MVVLVALGLLVAFPSVLAVVIVMASAVDRHASPEAGPGDDPAFLREVTWTMPGDDSTAA